jgi:hypothetical protein
MAEMSPAGDRLFIRLSGTDEACNRIVVVDVESGREIAIFTIAP